MRETVAGLLEKADLAIASASGAVSEDALHRIAELAATLRLRLDYPEDVLIAALAGGTGSGKSSLMNAIVGEEIAQAGGVRPTTARPLAVAPPSRLESVSGYLRGLGIEHVSAADAPEWLCLIDLPDTDSVELDHRLQVDSLLPRIDVVIWAADPEKYRDAALHSEYLEPLAGHADRFVFALNQIDRLADEERADVLADFSDALIADGIRFPKVVATAANPPAGPPLGIENLLEELAGLRGRAVLDKILTDLAQTCTELLDTIGHHGLGFRERSREVVGFASRLIAEGRVEKATNELTQFLEDLANRAGPFSGRIREISASVPGHVQAARDEITGTGRTGWLSILRGRPGESDQERSNNVTASIESRVMMPVGELLGQRAFAIGAITDLSVSVAAARHDLSV